MARPRRKKEEEETSYWLSYSDMMAALLLIFILIISFTLMQSKAQFEKKQEQLDEKQEIIDDQQKQLEEQQEELDRIVGIRKELIEALKDEFNGSSLNVVVDSKNGAITFDASVLFDSGKSELKPEGKQFLKDFVPRYCNILLSDEYKQYVSEIIIEGHTDTEGTYLYNLELSQDRAISAAKYCLTPESKVLSNNEIEELRDMLTANGRSFSNPIYNKDGTVNLEASRRVEFKFRLQDEQMVEEMAELLQGATETTEETSGETTEEK